MDMSLPIFPAPPGYVVDLANPQRSGQAANFWIGVVGLVLSSTLLCVRVYTKAVLARNIAADDVSILLAWIFSVAIQVIILFQYGRATLGIHIWELTGNQVNSSLNLVNIASILYCPFLALAKFSLLFTYLRLSRLRWFRLCVYANMFIVVGYNIALVFPLIFTCRPFMKNWDVTILEGTCINRTPIYMATAVLNMVTDIVLLVLPIPMIVKLQMPRVQKAGLICIFGVGSATCVTSAVRLVLLFPMLKSIDLTWAIVTPGIWILIEANLVIITGCLPTMRLFFRHVAPRLLGESSIRSRTHKSGTGYGPNTVHQSELKTMTSVRTKDPYKRMGDVDGVSLGSDEGPDAGWQGDSHSERAIVPLAGKGAIVKTETTVVRSEAISPAHKGRESWSPGY